MTNSLSFEELCRTARQHLRDGRAEEARDAFEEACRINDLDPDAHDGLALAQFKLANYEAAVRQFELVTRLDPRRGAAWVNLGAVYNRIGNYAKAAEVLRRAVQIEKKSGTAFYNLGFAYKHLKQWNMAVPAYREAIRLDPRMADAYLNLGNVYCELGNFPQAVTHYKKALELQPDFDRARRGLERAEARLAASKQAVSPFGRLVGQEPVPAEAAAPALAFRELTDDERIADRKALHELLTQLEVDLQDLLEALSSQLDPAVRTLNKLLTQPKSPHGVSISKSDAFDNFTEARAQYLPQLERFRQTLRRLRDHEAQIK